MGPKNGDRPYFPLLFYILKATEKEAAEKVAFRGSDTDLTPIILYSQVKIY